MSRPGPEPYSRRCWPPLNDSPGSRSGQWFSGRPSRRCGGPEPPSDDPASRAAAELRCSPVCNAAAIDFPMLATHLGHLAGDHRGEYLMTDGQERVAKLLEQVVTDLGATMAAG